MDVFHVVYKVICSPPPISLVLHLKRILLFCTRAWFIKRMCLVKVIFEDVMATNDTFMQDPRHRADLQLGSLDLVVPI